LAEPVAEVAEQRQGLPLGGGRGRVVAGLLLPSTSRMSTGGWRQPDCRSCNSPRWMARSWSPPWSPIVTRHSRSAAGCPRSSA